MNHKIKCAVCGGTFVSNRKSAVVCSEVCRRKRQKILNEQKRELAKLEQAIKPKKPRQNSIDSVGVVAIHDGVVDLLDILGRADAAVVDVGDDEAFTDAGMLEASVASHLAHLHSAAQTQGAELVIGHLGEFGAECLHCRRFDDACGSLVVEKSHVEVSGAAVAHDGQRGFVARAETAELLQIGRASCRERVSF